jgi:hypothetical protein
VSERAYLQNLRIIYKLKLPHLTDRGANQAAAAESQKKKTKQNTTQTPRETATVSNS